MNTTTVCFIACHEKILDYNFIDKEELNLILKMPIVASFYVYLSEFYLFVNFVTLDNGQCQLCYPRGDDRLIEKSSENKLGITYMQSRDIAFHCVWAVDQEWKLDLFWMLYWEHVPVTQWLSDYTQIWEKLFHCYSYNSILYDRNHMKYIYIALSKNLKVTGVFVMVTELVFTRKLSS